MTNCNDNISCIEYIPNFLPKEIVSTSFSDILKEVDFLSDEESAIVMMGKKINIPRKQCGYGDKGADYKFSGVKVEGKTWSDVPILNTIKEYIHEKLNIPVNFVLVNFYQNGDNYIGYHSDDEKDLNGKYPIISVSLGEERDFLLKNKSTGKIHKQVLHNNSCLLMIPPCQQLYKHSLPKRKKAVNPRINLTFRVIVAPAN
jgi:alpha-ketoglutarate-dependent dioxygenase alkB family protein 2